MNANLQLPAPAINAWLESASKQLGLIGIASARLDAEIILAHTLRRSRTYLHAHPDEILDARANEIADSRLALRLDRVPIAYIVGHKEFYGRQFAVTTATLIPRPESEELIETLKRIMQQNLTLFNDTKLRLIDVGTGSGCLGITAKLELPDLDVTLIDISTHALTVARTNAKRLHADVTLLKNDLLLNYPLKADIIIANLPYVDPSWERSPETNHEPELALFASDGGKALIYKLIDQSQSVLDKRGILLLEADPIQHESLTSYAKEKGFTAVSSANYCIALERT